MTGIHEYTLDIHNQHTQSTYPHGLVAAVGLCNVLQVGFVDGLAARIVVFVRWCCAKHHAVECGEEMIRARLCSIDV